MPQSPPTPLLIEAAEAMSALNAGEARAMDASFCLPTAPKMALVKYQSARLPHALFFDIEAIADPDSPLPHTMPSPQVFAQHLQRLGISGDDWLIVYDDTEFLSAARAWWMLRHFGHDKVSVLNGGLRAWREAGGKIESGTPPPPATTTSPANSTSKPIPSDADALVTLADMQKIIATPPPDRRQQILDARGSTRFNGHSPEPREGIASGHMPGALNCPMGEFLDAETGKLKPKKTLAAILVKCGVDMAKPVVTTCGSGITACGLAFVLAVVGKHDVRLYDGSWSEWGAAHQDRTQCPIAQGPIAQSQ